MRATRLFLIISFVFLSFYQLRAIGPLKDYSHIAGVCHGIQGDRETLIRDFEFCKRLNINSTRVWLSHRSYEQDPDGYIKRVQNYMRTAHEWGISVMPILFNGNNLDTTILKNEFHERGEKYVKAIIAALKDEPSLLMWDIMNEPVSNEYAGGRAPSELREGRKNKIWAFVRHYCLFVKKQDPKNAITVGVDNAPDLIHHADVVDVLSFHDYKETVQRMNASYEKAWEISRAHNNKPVINSEMSCIGRANPYDLSIEIARKHKAGFYVFNLICQPGGYWSDVHGLVYPDGTVRDPAAIAAMHGFYRNRDERTMIKANPNKEGYVDMAIALAEKVLKQETLNFRNAYADTDDILETAEICANLLESSDMVSMDNMPTARIRTWQNMRKEDRNIHEILDYTYKLAQLLKEKTYIF